MRSTSGGSCVAASTRTLRSMIQCDGVVTILMAIAGDRRRPPQDRGRSDACTCKRRERECSGNFRADSGRLLGDIHVSPPPLFPPLTTHLHTVRALDTQPSRLHVPVGRHPGHCLLVTAPSAQHNTTQHNTTQHNTTQHNTTQHNTTQHNTTQHNTTQHNTTQPPPRERTPPLDELF